MAAHAATMYAHITRSIIIIIIIIRVIYSAPFTLGTAVHYNVCVCEDKNYELKAMLKQCVLSWRLKLFSKAVTALSLGGRVFRSAGPEYGNDRFFVSSLLMSCAG